MQLTFLGKNTQGGGSPTLYASDQDSYVVQGWKVEGLPAAIEIPALLLRHLHPGVELDTELIPTGRRWRGDDGECETFYLSGTPLPDDVLKQLSVPDHEACFEVQRRRRDG
ncbi:hypothetical protein [Actinoplanes sp. L3-i22]|uniref:hypothetical protein n=1 Tax=Actinoplanes sp. L3-i22 TaxID=2836373 RepID=UPI001C74DBC3|nr:hypothetical protein [Actinoplanes sp. L3-i22]BCY14155.1 hypothetical protein L3i22_092430 [Actinoplanes sp. L3-i22]